MSASKKKMYKEEYYHLSEDEMQALIKRAKKGDGSAQNELLEIFSNFLSKYTAMLYYARFSLKDYDIRRFVALFVKDPRVRSFLLKNNLNAGGYKHVLEVMRGIQYMAQRYGDEEDIDQTVKMTFLQCVERYERAESKAGGYVPFSGYLYSYYFYLLKKNVDVFLIDQLGRKTFPLISDDESSNSMGEDEKPAGFTAPPDPGVEDMLHAEKIDEYWVAGDTAHPPYDCLTVQERQLLKWRFADGERSSDIANRITEHPNTVREHFNKIRNKLRIAIEEELEREAM